MRTRLPRRSHFIYQRQAPVEAFVAPVFEAPVDPLPYWITHGITRVVGASPALVFAPPGPVASIRRPFKERKINRGWLKLQAMQNGDCDRMSGYDDGEAEPQTRGIH